MRRLIVATLVSAGLIAGVGAATPALACERVTDTGICLDDADLPEPQPTPDPPSGAQPTGGGGSCLGAPGGECTDDYGYSWIPQPEGASAPRGQNGGCYGFILAPQPPAGDPRWEGHDPSEGSVWSCDPTVATVGNTWFVPNGQAPVVDAAAIAVSILERAPFAVADLRMAPPYDFHTYINLENWFWVPQGQWHSVSVSEDVGLAAVTLTARPSRIEVETGDGETTTSCFDAGRPWVKGMTDAATTTCAYAYSETSRVDAAGGYDERGRFTVVGRLYYNVSWTCAGRCSAPNGDLGEYPAPDSPQYEVDVRERLTVVTH